MIDEIFLASILDNINDKLNAKLNDNSNPNEFKSLPNAFEYIFTGFETDYFEFIKNSIIDRKYIDATIVMGFVTDPVVLRIMMSKMLVNFCELGNMNAFMFATENGADICYNNNLPFITACKNGNLNLVLALIEAGIRPNSIPQALIEASLNKQKEIIIELIRIDLDINLNNSSALILCAAKGLADMVDFLIQSGANIHALNDRSLIIATNNGHIETVRVLLNHGANPDVWNGHCFELAKTKNFTEILELLHAKKAEMFENYD